MAGYPIARYRHKSSRGGSGRIFRFPVPTRLTPSRVRCAAPASVLVSVTACASLWH